MFQKSSAVPLSTLCYTAQLILPEVFWVFNHHSKCLRKGEFWAVDNVSFELKRGECLGLIRSQRIWQDHHTKNVKGYLHKGNQVNHVN